MSTFPCATCGEPYEQERRRTTPYCPSCRTERHADKRRSWQQAKRARREDMIHIINEYTKQGMSPDYATLMLERLDEMPGVENLFDAEFDAQSMPPLTLANAAAGPDEGMSTYFFELGRTLDVRAREAAEHEWWADHPNWWVGMHDSKPIPDTAYLKVS